MTSVTRTRAPNSRARTTQLGTGELHQVLEDARDRAALAQFCSAHVCTSQDVSEDGRRLHMPRVLQLMRDRGYQVSEPAKSQLQPKAKQGFTAWLVHIRTPRITVQCAELAAVEFDIGFYTSNNR